MDETVLAPHEIHECAKVHQVDDLAVIDLADFRFFDDALDPCDSRIDLGLVGGRNLDQALVVDIDLGAGFRNDFADHLAAGSDNVADLFLVDLQRFDARSMFGHFCTNGAERLGHFTKDMRTASAGLFQSGFHDFLRDAGNLDVHLQGRDTLFGTRDLEVHVAEMIFVAEDVGQNRKIFAFENQAHRDTGNRTRQRHTGIHHRQRTTADGRHRGRTVGLGDVGQYADGVREVFHCRQYGTERAECELAVTGFAAAGKAETTDFTDRIGREVIVQHEVGVAQTVEPIDHLLGVFGSKRRGHDRLRFTTGEQGRTVGPWQQANHGFDRTNLIELAAIDTGTILEDRTANDFGFQLLDHLAGGHLGLAVCVGIFFLGLVANLVQRV